MDLLPGLSALNKKLKEREDASKAEKERADKARAEALKPKAWKRPEPYDPNAPMPGAIRRK